MIRCMTIGCTSAATVRMHYTMQGDGIVHQDNVCDDCHDSYSRRPSIHIVSVSPPAQPVEILAPGIR